MKNCKIMFVMVVLSLSGHTYGIHLKTYAAWLLAVTQTTSNSQWNRYTLVGHHTKLETSTQTLVDSIHMLEKRADGSTKSGCLIKPEKNFCQSSVISNDILFGRYTFDNYPAFSVDMMTAPACNLTHTQNNGTMSAQIMCQDNQFTLFPLAHLKPN